jgi:hypothetical protein
VAVIPREGEIVLHPVAVTPREGEIVLHPVAVIPREGEIVLHLPEEDRPRALLAGLGAQDAPVATAGEH